jgi:two-component system, LytTR family, sensor histidine kinase LytS
MDERNTSRRFVLLFILILLLVAITLMIVLGWGITIQSTVATGLVGAALAIVVVLASLSFVYPDTLRSRATERTLRVASNTLDHMRYGLMPDSCQAVCKLLLPETAAQAISMCDTKKVLAYVGEDAAAYPSGSENSVRVAETLKSGRLQTFQYTRTEIRRLEEEGRIKEGEVLPAGVIAPLVVQGKTVGAITFYYRYGRTIDRTQIAIARGLANLLSTQLTSYELDLQAELTARAEVKALQAQINPHFLFNTLNTIASLIRTDPAKARVLLRDFAAFYRQTLEGSEQMLPLSRELEQTRRYLTFEHARFGEDRIVETEHIEPGLERMLVPSFIIQPIVENAIRHAMRDEGALHIDVHAVRDGDDVLIAVTDDGVGMDPETLQKLTETVEKPHTIEHGPSSKGTGIALHNVAERIKRFYGADSGIEIVSKVDQGTQIALRLGGAAAMLES